MFLKDDRIIVEVDGVRFTSFNNKLPEFVLDPTAVVGWDDGVSVRRDVTVRPTTWGDFSEKGRMGSRLVSLSGMAVANNPYELKKLRNDFASILNDGEYKEMSLQDNYDKRYLSVGLEGASSWVRKTDSAAAWRMDLYAPDPRLLGEVKVESIGDGNYSGGLSYPIRYPINYNTPETVTAKVIRNEGNTDAWPTFQVTGNFYSGFSITNGRNRTVSFSGMVTTKSPVKIDMFKGTATQNGVDKTILMKKREWFSIPPASSIRPEFLPAELGTGWCDIIYRDTWI